MTDVTIYANGATVTGCLKELLAGRPMAGPVRGDRQTIRITLTVQGPDTVERVTDLLQATGVEPAQLTTRSALILAANLLDAEIRRLDADALAFLHGCEDSQANARRHDELSQALAMIREMLIEDAAV